LTLNLPILLVAGNIK